MIESLYKVLEGFYKNSPIPLKKLSQKVLELSDYFNSTNPPTIPYGEVEDYRYAYLYYFYPLNVYKYLTILNYYKKDLKDCKAFLDIGAGPLTFYTSLSLLNFEPQEMYALDKSREFMESGKKILNKIDSSFTKKIKYGLPTKKMDLINFGNIFAELEEEKVIDFLDDYLRYLEEDRGYILILEPGTKRAFKKTLKIKDYLIQRGFSLLNDCPAHKCWKEDDWCHENIYFPRNVLIMNVENQNKLNNKFINFIYLLMKKGEERIENKEYHKVISNLIKHKGRYLLEVCGKEKISRYELMERDLSQSNKDFLNIRRGDIIEIKLFELKGEVFRLNKNSTVKIIKKWALNPF